MTPGTTLNDAKVTNAPIAAVVEPGLANADPEFIDSRKCPSES
jgi:hypothetical protein